MENYDLENKIKIQIGEVIIKLNIMESRLKQIISKYIEAKNNDILEDVLLNNMYTNISTKWKILRHILIKKKIPMNKDLHTSFQIVLNKRNILAHSESLLDTFGYFDDVDFNVSKDSEAIMYGVFKVHEPIIPVIQNDQINYEELDKIITDFNKHYKNCENGLSEISEKLFQS